MYQYNKDKNIYFLYARKSSESEERQVQSIDDQISRLKELASRLGIEIKEIITESKSAKKPYNRPLFTDMLLRIKKGEANGILCWHLNRLFRNPTDQGNIGQMLQDGVIKSIQTMEKEYRPDDNVLLYNLEAGMANQFIIDLKKACRRGMEGKAERGWLPALAPVGYKNDKANRAIILDPERFDLVRRMWEMMLTGNYTVGAIRRIATEQWGFRAPQYKKNTLSVMHNNYMYKMFSNIFYTGMFDWDGKRYIGNHTPMISMGEFDKVQDLLGRNGRPRPKTHLFPYTGLIQCGVCGSMFTATEKKKYLIRTKEFKYYTYYHCTKKRKTVTCHGQKPMTEKELVGKFELELIKYAIHPVFLGWAKEKLQTEREKKNSEKLVIEATHDSRIEETEKELPVLTRMRMKEFVDDTTFITEKERLNKELLKYKHSAIENTKNPTKWIDLTEQTFDFAFYAYKSMRTKDINVRKAIVSSLGSNFRIKEENLLFDGSEWLIPIEKGYPVLFEEFQRLELNESIDFTGRNAALDSIFIRWCTIVEDVRTIFENLNDTTIQIPSIKPNDNQQSF